MKSFFSYSKIFFYNTIQVLSSDLPLSHWYLLTKNFLYHFKKDVLVIFFQYSL